MDAIVGYFFEKDAPNCVLLSHSEKYNNRLLKFRMFACLLLTVDVFITLLDSKSYLDQIIYLTSFGFQSSYLFFIISVQYYLLQKYFEKKSSTHFYIEHMIQALY